MPYKDPQKLKEYQKKHNKKYQEFYNKTNKRLRDFLEIKKCLNCQKEFEPKNKQQKFCSCYCRHFNWVKFHFVKEANKKVKKKKRNKNYIRNYDRNYYMKKRYGISYKEYQILLEKQNGKCAICKEKETRKNKYGGTCRLHIDHNHKTNKVRGILCNKCNACLGLIGDRIDLLKKMIEYLEKDV